MNPSEQPDEAKGNADVKFYTVEEAAPLLRMGRSTLYRAINEGKVPYTLDPLGRRRFTDADIKAIVADGHRPKAA